MPRRRHSSIFLTGATGLIGGELLARLLNGEHDVWVLCRSRAGESAGERVARRLLRGTSWSGQRQPRIISGDITAEGWGIRQRDVRDMMATVDTVVHAAAETGFRRSDPCYVTNVRGIRNLLQLTSAHAWYPRVFYLSTASVTTAPSGRRIEEEARFAGYQNGYISSKRKAETVLLGQYQDAIILRPSIVVGRGLSDRSFARSILWVIPVLLHLGIAPFGSEYRVDIVPADWVVACIESCLSLNLQRGRYHLSADRDASPTCGAILEVIRQRHPGADVAFGQRSAWENARRQSGPVGRLVRAVDYYVPFIEADVVYSNCRLKRELGEGCPPLVPFTTYCLDLLAQVTRDEAIMESELP